MCAPLHSTFLSHLSELNEFILSQKAMLLCRHLFDIFGLLFWREWRVSLFERRRLYTHPSRNKNWQGIVSAYFCCAQFMLCIYNMLTHALEACQKNTQQQKLTTKIRRLFVFYTKSSIYGRNLRGQCLLIAFRNYRFPTNIIRV